MANEMLVNVLWMSMDPGTRSHVSSTIDPNADVDFQVMGEAVMRHTTLVGATSGAAANRSTAMDIGSIASVTDAEKQPGGGEAPVVVWTTDDGGWPTDEEGTESWTDGQINLFKGKGKGKGECWNCGQKGHQAAHCTNPPSTGQGQYGYKG